ncbi:TPA: ead/Ea22-like family protein [Klebsiella pneumoniae]|nr:ead/Ea22-like family protein [Klebsiella pneumoniae]
MTDITELAQSLKAAAEKATPGEWRRASTQFNGITATPFMLGRKEVMIAGVSEKRDAEFIALANPANILALVEALEKAQRYIEELRDWNAGLAQESCERQQLISELEPIRAAAEKLVRCKGRYHSEQNYRALAALFGVNTPDLPPLDDESHAVTVENLQESAYRAGLTAGWNLGLANDNDGFNKCLAAHAAGIKVEAE